MAHGVLWQRKQLEMLQEAQLFQQIPICACWLRAGRDGHLHLQSEHPKRCEQQTPSNSTRGFTKTRGP